MRNNKIYNLAILALFIALQIILTFTPAGYLQIGVLYLTTLHIPVILVSILLGLKEGLVVGFVFGLTSLAHATFIPALDSVFFSPFYSGNIASLVVVIVPRVLLPVCSYYLFKLTQKYKINESIGVIISSVVSTVVHTCLVMGFIYLFFYDEYSALTSTNFNNIFVLIGTVLLSNGLFEAILAALINAPVYNVLKKVRRR